MTLPTYYATGTASVNNGSTTITFAGTALGTAELPTFQAGDLFFDPSQPMVPGQRLAGVDNVAQTAELWVGWPGANMVAAPYEVRFTEDGVRGTAQTRRYLERLGQLSALGIQPNAFGELADRAAFDDEAKGFIFLSLTGTWTLFIKNSAATADWVTGQAIEGPRGSSGLIGDWRAAWVPGTYNELDAVEHDGSAYIVKKGVVSTSQEPPGSDWDTIAAKGDRGDPGDDGLGVPAGGSTRQTLQKASNADNDTIWSDDLTVAAAARTPIWMPGRDYALPVGGGVGTAAMINAAIAAIGAARGGELLLPPETITLDATIDNNVPHVVVRGMGRAMWNDAGATGFGTLLLPTFAGTVLRHRTPYGGASQAQHRGGGFVGITVSGNAIATRLLEVDSVRLGTYDLYLGNSVGTEAALFKTGVSGTDIGDSADVQDCDINLRVRQTNAGASANAHCVVFGGSSNANVSINTGLKLDLMHLNGDGLVLDNADNNVFELFRAYRPSGTGVSLRSRANGVDGRQARSNFFEFFSANTSPVFEGTNVATFPSTGQISELDLDNGTPMPTLGPGASCPVLNSKDAWTPVLSFATAGNLAVSYSIQQGTIVKMGKLRLASFVLVTSALAHSTASGNLQISGLPDTNEDTSNAIKNFNVSWSGITKSGFTQVNGRIAANSNLITFQACGSGLAAGMVTAADVPSGGTVALVGTAIYMVK